ncbi:MAG: cation acetate symporter, partial [Sciscionella sp.]|nr:cation acetate symporter [Sciscionella sp.]
MQANPFAIAGMVIIGALTFLLGYFSSRGADATPDFLAARRMVRSRRNAAAISGEYLSAASFLGIAGLVLKDGISALWYPIGFATGYLALLLFIAAPLRRSGAYTVPDFAEARLGSASLRRLCTICVLLIGLLYLVPQLQGAGLTLSTVLPAAPVWLGGAVVTVLVVLNVAAGGMRAVTLVQAFQYWVKLFAIAAPTFVLFAVFLGGPYGIRSADQHTLSAPNPPVFSTARRIDVRTPVEVEVQQPVQLRASGLIDNFHTDGGVIWAPGIPHQLDAGTTLWFDKGSPVPVVMGAPSTNASWLNQPAGDTGALIDDLSLLFALIAGTMGLPHVLVRFYTNPDGRDARRTTLVVIVLLSSFYLLPTLFGAFGR